MRVDDYIHNVGTGLSSRRYVVNVDNLMVRRVSDGRAHIRARIHFFDDSFLDFRENVDTYRCYPQHIVYSYQYLRNDEKVFRYDNAPDHPDVPTFPHHKHVGSGDEETIIESDRPSHNALFNEIYQHFDQ